MYSNLIYIVTCDFAKANMYFARAHVMNPNPMFFS